MGTREYLINKAKNEGIEEIVSSIQLKTNFSDAEIAEMLNLPSSLVKNVRAKQSTQK